MNRLVAWLNRLSARIERRNELLLVRAEIQAEVIRIKGEEEIARIEEAARRLQAKRRSYRVVGIRDGFGSK